MPRDHDNPNVTYTEVIGPGDLQKVTAVLRSKDSAAYTNLAKKLEQLSSLESEIKKLREQVTADTKQLVADLFDAEDAAKTRVVETVSVVFVLSKDPKPTENIKYAKLIEELEQKMTPALIKVLKALKKKYTTVVRKSPSLSYHGVMPESVVREGIGSAINLGLQRILRELRTFRDEVVAWGSRYDAALNRIKRQIHT